MAQAVAPSLKRQNERGLAVVTALNLVLFYAAVGGTDLVSMDWQNLAEDWPAGLGGLIATILVNILSAQLSPDTKARIVFWRWHHPLPGSRAFSHYAKHDPRIDIEALASKIQPMPTMPREQNALWYRLYRDVQNDPAVSHVHRAFLFARDYACIVWMLVGILGSSIWFFTSEPLQAISFITLLVLQYALAATAARRSGQRLVTTVLAITAANWRKV